MVLETFLAEAQEADPMGWGVPRWVERDFRSYLRCGILAHGFARLRCSDCGHDRLLAFSCKGRGVCPSCNARRMAEVAAHLNDEVIPHLPPKRLRPFLHQAPEVASAVLALFLRTLRSALRDASPGAPDAVRDAQLGAISFPQRFGSSLNPHYHYHRVLAPNARLRSTVVSIGRPMPHHLSEDVGSPRASDQPDRLVAPLSPSRQTEPSSTQAATPRSRSSRMLWAPLLARIYEVLPLLCRFSPENEVQRILGQTARAVSVTGHVGNTRTLSDMCL